MEACKVTRVSLVVRVFDDYDLKPVEKGVLIYINEYKATPIKKPGGYYIFTNLAEETYSIKVLSPDHIEESCTFPLGNLDKLNPVVNIRLKPKSMPALKNNEAAVQFRALDKQGFPIKGGDIKAVLCTRHAFVGQKVMASEAEIQVEEFCGEFFSGDHFYIGEEEQGEFITILHKLQDKQYKLKNALKFGHSYGEKLYKAFIHKTDNEGNGVIYFTKLLGNKNKIKISIAFKELLKEVEVEVEGNSMVQLGDIFL